MLGDCVKLMQSLPKESIDMILTSPPYDDIRDYKGYAFEFEAIADGMLSVLKKGGVLVWVVGDRINGGRSMTSFKQALYLQKIGLKIHDVMIYQKKNTPFMRSNAYTNCHELMIIASKGKPKTFNPLKEPTVRSGKEMLVHNKGRDGVNKKVLKELKKEKTRTNIWAYAVGAGGSTNDKFAFEHPAIFPENLATDHILSWSNYGDFVLDPMCGSGTTCKMAKINGRNYIGMDISEEYVKLSRKRVRNI